MVNKSAGHVNFRCQTIQFVDKDTNQVVLYAPALDITGYGDTVEEAFQIFQFCSVEFCKHLISLKSVEINRELVKLGWKPNTTFKKRYSKAFIDEDGDLKNFNALDDKIEIRPLEIVV